MCIDAEGEDVLLRRAHVLEQLPRRVLEACGVRSAPALRDTVDRLFEADVRFFPVEDSRQLRPKRVGGFLHGVSVPLLSSDLDEAQLVVAGAGTLRTVSRPSVTVTVDVPSTHRVALVGVPFTVSTPST